jgi:hypothetical protein
VWVGLTVSRRPCLVCDRQMVTERHVISMMFISAMEWIMQREGRGRRIDPSAPGSPALQLEVS